jgi:DNA-binding CsgD family transcriptional regulator
VTNKDKIADLLSKGYDFGEISAKTGIDRKNVRAYLVKIRRELGKQAV